MTNATTHYEAGPQAKADYQRKLRVGLRQMRRYKRGNLRSVPMRTRELLRRALRLKADPRP